MATIHLYLSIYNNALNNAWNKRLTSGLQAVAGVEQVLIIEQNESGAAQVNVDYDVLKTSLEDIEKITLKSGAAIAAINIHFPSEITGISDPYGASAISIPVDEQIGHMPGVLGVSISSGGSIKVEIAPAMENKNRLMQKIIRNIKSRSSRS